MIYKADSARMLETLLGNLPGMVCRFKNDIDWTMEYMSQGCFALTGYEPEELIDNKLVSYGKITICEDNIAAWETIQAAVKNKERYQLEYRIKTKTGEEKWVWEQGLAIFNDNGELEAIEAFMTDITKQKHVDLQYSRLISELSERNAELDTFVYRVSHDIRSPLLTLYGLTNLMRDEPSLDSLPDYCNRIDRTVKRLDEFTKELLTYTRTKEYKEERLKVDFQELINVAFQDTGYPLYHTFISVENIFKLKGDVYSEIFRLKTILSNLYSNSIKYRDPEKRMSYIKTEVYDDHDSFTIKITDNGLGIDPKYKEDVFKMFFRASEVSEGSGLGLYIAKLNVVKLNGEMHVADLGSETGTVFTMVFPKA